MDKKTFLEAFKRVGSFYGWDNRRTQQKAEKYYDYIKDVNYETFLLVVENLKSKKLDFPAAEDLATILRAEDYSYALSQNIIHNYCSNLDCEGGLVWRFHKKTKHQGYFLCPNPECKFKEIMRRKGFKDIPPFNENYLDINDFLNYKMKHSKDPKRCLTAGLEFIEKYVPKKYKDEVYKNFVDGFK